MNCKTLAPLPLLTFGHAALARIFVVALVLGAVVLAAPAARAQTYDLAADWSITANPIGAWTYGKVGASLSFFDRTIDAAYLGDFSGQQPSWDGGYPLVLGKSNGTCIHDFPPNRVGGHTSNNSNTFTFVRWTAPTDGLYKISGGGWMFRDIGRRCLISLYINEVPLFDDVLIPARSAGCNSGAPFSLTAAMIADRGSAYDLSRVPLAAGDTVTMAVRKTTASPYGDYVGLDLTISFSGNQRTSLFVPNVTGLIGKTVNLTATLKRKPDRVAIADKPVTFKVDGIVVGSGITDASGVASFPYTVPNLALGDHTTTADFAGDEGYGASTDDGILKVKSGTSLSVPNVTGSRGTTVTLNATLWNASDGTLLSGKSLKFTVDGVLQGTAVTDASGVASFAYTIPAGAALGKHTIKVNFAADTLYAASSKNATLTVNP